MLEYDSIKGSINLGGKVSMDLLVTFVIPILVIIVAAILQTILNCPFKVAGLVFVVAVIVAIVLGGSITLIALAWFYTVFAFVAAYLICRFFRWECRSNNCTCCSQNSNTGNVNSGNNNTGNNNTGNNNSGNNNVGNNNSGNNNTGNNNSGNNNTGNNNSGNNNGNSNTNCRNRCCRCSRG